MVGGLTELVCKGQMDTYININPDISFFKFAYKKHTNFAFESIRMEFEINPLIDRKNVIYKCKLSRYADLLSNIYFIYKLPAIFSSNKHKFRWIKNVGTLIIKRATLTIGATVIDNLSGEWLLIQNEYTKDVKDTYDEMTGNVKGLYNPQIPLPLYRINNNIYTDILYPDGNKDLDLSSINERRIVLPLSFNFTKNPALALQMLKLQGAEVYVNIELEDVENLYQVFSSHMDMYVSPKFYNELYPNEKIDINTFIKTRSLGAYIEGNYIFLDNDERGQMMIEPITRILIEQLFISNYYSVKAGNQLSTTIDLNGANNHIKEIIWTLRRDDFYKFNGLTNYTNSVPENKLKPILDSAIINFDKTNRIEQKEADFFRLIQAYQHHNCIPSKQGIYCYSFGFYPDKYQPTGSFNGACLSTSLCVYVNSSDNSFINNKLIKFGRDTYTYNYELVYYIRGFNILEYNGGIVGIKYV